MSTLQQPTKRADAVDRSETEARPIPERGGWANFFYGMGSVLELFPSGDIPEPADTEDALAVVCENVNRAVSVAFERLVSQYEETVTMAPVPKQSELLSPEVIEKYKQIVPDFPQHWLAMMEEEAQHHRQMEARAQEIKAQAQEAQFAERKRGQVLGLAIGLAAIIAGSVTAVYGAEWAGLGIGGGGVIGLVSVFVLGKKGK